MNSLSQINPVPSDMAAHLASDQAFADLSEQIMSTPVPESGAARRRSLWRFGAPLAAGLAAAALITGVVVQPWPVGGRPAMAQALTFTRHGQWIDVIVRDAAANPAVYRAEFKAHSLDIHLSMVPASPSMVGKLVSFGFSIPDAHPITNIGKCGGPSACPVGLRIPFGYRGWADLVFGRAAKPGERYAVTGPATAPGEVLHGVRYKGLTVAEVLALLRQRHATVADFTHETKNDNESIAAADVPGTWFVYDAEAWAPGKVQLFVGPARKAPQPGPSRPGPSGASPSPSPSPSPRPSLSSRPSPSATAPAASASPAASTQNP